MHIYFDLEYLNIFSLVIFLEMLTHSESCYLEQILHVKHIPNRATLIKYCMLTHTEPHYLNQILHVNAFSVMRLLLIPL